MDLFVNLLDNEGAAAAYVRPNPHNDQRQPHKITVETYSNKQNESSEGCDEPKGILPSGSREQTPIVATIVENNQTSDYETMGFFYGNPYVEVTKGIIHFYKKK